ncbi:activator of 90 kDa heat shock protein ATPase homolog 1 [Chrysoperla carnea]|uniref:activator of 90 kDa heat shock protein ATPase homolog 1 n=1 Tax=Chrysoperla carnea TaxID=189513 RepID=UPI001D075E51|nr:activator of 90 kDa heat shock protein ATPase homolog 1 [Chrysoperla carnea]
MAKWGEGDPRWIVEERPDATNVNNWHWTERNASSWSIDRLKELFKNLKVDSDVGDLKIVESEKCDGEASANNRKGKLIFFYEWNLVLKWEGKLLGGSGDLVEGKVTIPNLSEENDISEVEITITLNSTSEEGEILKAVMHNVGRDLIRKQLSVYVLGLREEFSKGMILPKKEDVKPDCINNLSSGFNSKISMNTVQTKSAAKEKEVKTNIPTTDFELTQKFQCPGVDLYNALTDRGMVNAWTRGAVEQIEPKPGGQFSLFGNNIVGEFVELDPPNKIVQKWRYKQWPAGHFSTVTLKLKDKGDHTELVMNQVGVPKTEHDVTIQNWQQYYWESIQRTFGWGAFFDYT